MVVAVSLVLQTAWLKFPETTKSAVLPEQMAAGPARLTIGGAKTANC